jgi:fatty acid synthase subunit alpha, fungi type
VEKVKEMLGDIVTECFERAKALQKSEGHISLERGFATIPLPGIDVPFHLRYLWAGVMPFRGCNCDILFLFNSPAYKLSTDLSKKVHAAKLNPDMLIGKYIPNLVAKPFDISREYVQLIYDQTSSPRLDKVLKKWDQDNWASPEQRQKLAYIILVELLAYQFASPVRWIETQDYLFKGFAFERFIEIGPSPTLTGMATRTLRAKYEARDDSVTHPRAILCDAKNGKDIYYQLEDDLVAAEAESIPDAAPAISSAPTPAPIAVSAPSGPATSVEDVPIKANDVLNVIVAQKLKKVDEVPVSKSIKELVGGKSTLQNEFLGDLQMEFGEELPLEELGAALDVGYSGSLGKCTSGLISRMVSGKMPGGFNITSIKGHLSKAWGLGPSRFDVVLLLGITMEPAKRLGSEAEAKGWLDTS